MFLVKFLLWLLLLPFRLLLFVLGAALWVLTLPLRIVFGILGLIGFRRILQLGIIGAIGYFFYRLVNQSGDEPFDTARVSAQPTSAAELRSAPST